MSNEYSPTVGPAETAALPAEGPARKKPGPKPGAKKVGRPSRAETEKRQRRRRKDHGGSSRMKLTVPDQHKDKAYHYRWIRNEPARVRALTLHDDYDVVQDEGLSQEELQRGLGIIPERHGGVTDKGDSYNMILVRKPMEYHLEDQEEKAKRVEAVERSIKRGQPDAPDGQSGPTQDGNAYVPEGNSLRFKDGMEP